jgi:hypothetical protein
MRASATKQTQTARRRDTPGTARGTSALQQMADRSPTVQRLAALQAAASDGTGPVAQLQPIGPAGAGYQALRCGATFFQDHLARNQRQAEQKTLARAGARGMLNTVLLHNAGDINTKVAAAEYEDTWSTGVRHQYAVPITGNYLELEALVGANGRRIKSVSDRKTGTVNVKAYFDDTAMTFRVTGVHSVG